MSPPRFYLSEPLLAGASVVLSETVFTHAVRVLRLKPGATIVLFNGQGGEYTAVLEQIDKKHGSARLLAYEPREAESPLAIVLVQAISKGERMDYTLQKAVELGVHSIQPVFSERSVVSLSAERLAKRLLHWQGVVSGACEQCGRNRLPVVEHPKTLQAWLSGGPRAGIILDPVAEQSLDSIAQPCAPVALVVGPEGGLSRSESDLAQQAGLIPISIGPRVLRTETASVVALANMQMRWGDLGRQQSLGGQT